MVELKIEDWERAKTEAEGMIKQAMIMLEVNDNLLQIAEAKIKALTPEKKPNENTAANSG